MTVENMIRAIAGSFVVISLTLGYVYSPYWHLFTAFVGFNLLQSAFTHWCLMEKILIRLNLGKPSHFYLPTPEPYPAGFELGRHQQREIQPPPGAPPV